MVFVCQMTLPEHAIKALNDFMVRRLSKLRHHPNEFSGHRPTSSGEIIVLECHVNKGSCDFMVRSPSRYITILPSFLVIGLLVVEI